jgi:hypothetical protein
MSSSHFQKQFMIEIPPSRSISDFEQKVGGPFSLYEKIKLGGTGSAKVIHLKGLNGIPNLESEEQDFNYTSFELFSKGLIIRTAEHQKTKSFLVLESEVKSIRLIRRRMKVKNRRLLTKSHHYIVNDAKIELKLNDELILTFYVPTTFFKPIDRFFRKLWLNDKTEFEVLSKEPIQDQSHWLTLLMSSRLI